MDRVLADLVLALHFAFVVFVVAGGLLVLRSRAWAWLHLPAAAWGFLVEAAGLGCPLTPLENELRERAGEQGYAASFLEHWLEPVLYPAGLTRGAQLALAAAVVFANALVYAWVLARLRSPSRGPNNRSA